MPSPRSDSSLLSGCPPPDSVSRTVPHTVSREGKVSPARRLSHLPPWEEPAATSNDHGILRPKLKACWWGPPSLPTHHTGPPHPTFVSQLNWLHTGARTVTTVERFFATEPRPRRRGLLCDPGLPGSVGSVFYAFPVHKSSPNADWPPPGGHVRDALVPRCIFPGPSALLSSWPAVCPEQPPQATWIPRSSLHICPGGGEPLCPGARFLLACPSFGDVCCPSPSWERGRGGSFSPSTTRSYHLSMVSGGFSLLFMLKCVSYFAVSIRISFPSSCVSFNFFARLFRLCWYNSCLLGNTNSIIQSLKSTCSAGDLSSIPGLGRLPGEGNGNPL